MTASLPPELVQLLGQLRRLSEISVQDDWFFRQGETLTPAAPNEKGYLVWEKGRCPAELTQEITVPETVKGYPTRGLILRLALTWWAEEAEIYVNGEFVQGGDLFDSKTRILLTPNAQPGQIFNITLKLISPGHDIGGLMESRLIFEKPTPELEPGFITDEFTILAQYLAQSAPENLERLTLGLAELPWERVGKVLEFDQALTTLREHLKPLAQDLKRRSFHLLAHAHLDLAWLWPLAETWEAAERTFRSVLSLQEEFPDLIFGHTSPALYEWLEMNRPELFEAIKTAVQNRRWELLGGMWVEPDVNLPGAESLVRQLLYGQRYFLSRFGQLAQVAWLPDSFGFCQQLPQLFKQAGIEVFFTGKLHWNDTNQFPHGIFNWRAPDGTDCLTLMSPPNLAGVMDTQPRPMADYGLFWEAQTGLTAMLWLPGMGDHGGGPSRDMWEVKRRWQNSDFFPEIKTGRAEDYVNELKERQEKKLNNLPIWTEDLYLELHRGCYTTHGEQKKCNRRSEYVLYEAELWSSFAVWFTGAVYPQGELERVWKKVLLNQFHDILPGTSIPEVFEDANADWGQVLKTGEALVNQALEKLSSRIRFSAPPRPQAQPLVVFNSLNQSRSEAIVIPYPAEIFDLEGKALTTQFTPEGETLFSVENVPALGYQSYWVLAHSDSECQGETLTPLLPPSATLREREKSDKGNKLILDNGILKATLDVATGEIASLYDARHQREVLDGNGNQLQFFQDQGQYWDAWNIDPDYESHPLEGAELTAITLLENGPLRWRLRVEKTFRNSRFQQDYVLEAQSPALKIINRVHWQERRVLVKVAFPLGFSSETFTAETPGAVRVRPTRPQTSQARAQWEIPHRQWLDLTDPDLNYGVSLLNDCKYGADVGPSRLRLSLLRGSLWPDPQADLGDHEFTYALLPHVGDWRSAGVVQAADRLNCPLRVYCPLHINPNGALPPRQSLLNLNNESLALLALKPLEEDSQAWVIRVNDPLGQRSEFNPDSPRALTLERRLDLLERALDSSSRKVNPWEIASFQVRVGAIFKCS